MLFLEDAYRRTADAIVTLNTEEGHIILDAPLFYATSGGQPGDAGVLHWSGGTCEIATTQKGDGGRAELVPVQAAQLPPAGTPVVQEIDWPRRYAHMKVHTALHLLSVVIPLPVTGGAVSATKGRLDFDMPQAPESKDDLEAQLNALIARDYAVSASWITDAELNAQPELVKTMSVRPPAGQGRVRLIRIGSDDVQIDLQPCGGTHVARTSEIGAVRLGKIEKKGRQNRRVTLHMS